MPETEVGRPALIKAGLCWQALTSKPCKFGDECKKHHLSLDQVLSRMTHEDDNAMEIDQPKRPTLDVQKKLDADLYKTRLCFAYQTGSCKRGSSCIFIHMAGPDAKAIAARAMASKVCPYESNLGECPQRICFFKHEKRESSPVDPLGKPYRKYDEDNFHKAPLRAYRYFDSEHIDVEKLENWRKAPENSLKEPCETEAGHRDLIKLEEIDD